MATDSMDMADRWVDLVVYVRAFVSSCSTYHWRYWRYITGGTSLEVHTPEQETRTLEWYPL